MQRSEQINKVVISNNNNNNIITVKPALNGNIFRSRDFGAEKDVKYPGLNGNSLKRKQIKISLYTENFQSSRIHRLEEF
jgi:hypothetical protein